MAVRVAEKTVTVARCVPRQGGGYLILTRKGESGVSRVELPEGTAIVFRDGQAVRAH